MLCGYSAAMGGVFGDFGMSPVAIAGTASSVTCDTVVVFRYQFDVDAERGEVREERGVHVAGAVEQRLERELVELDHHDPGGLADGGVRRARLVSEEHVAHRGDEEEEDREAERRDGQVPQEPARELETPQQHARRRPGHQPRTEQHRDTPTGLALAGLDRDGRGDQGQEDEMHPPPGTRHEDAGDDLQGPHDAAGRNTTTSVIRRIWPRVRWLATSSVACLPTRSNTGWATARPVRANSSRNARTSARTGPNRARSALTGVPGGAAPPAAGMGCPVPVLTSRTLWHSTPAPRPSPRRSDHDDAGPRPLAHLEGPAVDRVGVDLEVGIGSPAPRRSAPHPGRSCGGRPCWTRPAR